MQAPSFWWSARFSFKAMALFPIGWVYGLVAGRRMMRAPRGESRLPVICIGNYVAGGAGKTPFSLMLAELLAADGHRPGFLLRGHGGRLPGPVLVDPQTHASQDVGDEALLLAQSGPTVVARDRVAGAHLAEQQAIDILVMDDGFQNPDLKKDLRLVLVDAQTGVGNGLCIPAGPLRAPLETQMRQTDVLVIVGDGDRAGKVLHHAGRKGVPILKAGLTAGESGHLAGLPLFAFAGIGRPGKFFSTLTGLGLDLRKTRSFSDHHAFTEKDASELLRQAESEDLQLVTTEKDMVRIETSRSEIFRWLENRTETLAVAMHVDDPARLKGLVRQTLRSRSFQSGATR
ncbi:tetraacyldisaccharide 4'-kinase [Roseibium aquae]|uniref:Tetraacyldisaccharide 4'-kinase n=1 Tax=Roseibium aquae TaxID=1323746 RepID=A0A916TL81_9HYPH|nr:tetraacyldisaccharide 4'-kinase [Roseibium aquae]GGB52386.1 tetraacyldisaccharide 4'-kinase [Roseibium aquae]